MQELTYVYTFLHKAICSHGRNAGGVALSFHCVKADKVWDPAFLKLGHDYRQAVYFKAHRKPAAQRDVPWSGYDGTGDPEPSKLHLQPLHR